MAYEPRAAIRSHTADTFSPRDRARTAQPIAPTTATAVQTSADLRLTRAPGARGGDMAVLPRSKGVGRAHRAALGRAAGRGRAVMVRLPPGWVTAGGTPAESEQICGDHAEHAQ